MGSGEGETSPLLGHPEELATVEEVEGQTNVLDRSQSRYDIPSLIRASLFRQFLFRKV